jgi:hypothetical protein
MNFYTGSSVCITTSGLVPGGGVDARTLKLKIDFDGEELLDGVFPFCLEGLCAKSEDYDVILVFLWVLVICKPTGGN